MITNRTKKAAATAKLLALIVAALLCLPGHGHAQELWFGPGDDLDVNGRVAHPTYSKLFAPDAPWRTGYQRIDVFMLRAPWLLRTNPAQTRQALDFLSEHHIKIAAPMVGVATDDCGQGMEGTMSARQMDVYPREMKRLGMPLDYAEMDEPLFYGHYFHDNPKACRYSITEVATRVATSIRIVQKYFPDTKFVLIEPVLDDPRAPAELVQFLRTLKDDVGFFPVNVRFDIAWSRSHRQQSVPNYIRAINTLGIGYSFVSDAANGRITDDRIWTESAKTDTLEFERVIRQQPAQIVVQSWSPAPEKLLPETDPSTMTGLLKWMVEHTGRAAPPPLAAPSRAARPPAAAR